MQTGPSDKLAAAIASLEGYCLPWEDGGAGHSALAADIRVVLAEVTRLQTELDGYREAERRYRDRGKRCFDLLMSEIVQEE